MIKRKIAIFGDSFAKHIMPDNPTPSWAQILAQDYKIDNFGEMGSSLFYSVELFLKNQHLYERVIFCITSAGRLTLPERSWIKDPYNSQVVKCVTSLTADQNRKNPQCLTLSRRIYQTAFDYFIHLQNNQYDHYVHELMINDLKSKRPDALFLDSMFELNQVFEKENEHYNLTREQLITEYNDIRNCHMTRENNMILAEKIKGWISTGKFKHDINDYINPTDPFEMYFIKK